MMNLLRSVTIGSIALGVAGLAGAQTVPRGWTSFSAGFGPAGATMRGDTVYEGSGQVVGLIAVTRVLSPRRAVEFAVLGGHPFGAGDCVPGFSVCAPPFNFLGASASLVTSIRAPVAPDRLTAGIGAGVFRVAPTEDNRVTPRPAAGLQANVEAPLIVTRRAAIVFGIRGLVFPMVHGQTLSLGLLSMTVRGW